MKYERNENAFEQIETEEQAYWLGFILADGCISANRLGVKLKRSDEHHLLKLRQFLKYTGPLEYERTQLGESLRVNGKHSFYETVRLRVASKKMSADLMRHGIIPRKSLTAIFPIISHSLDAHFIRGYIDGDGNWCWCGKRSKSIVLTILGTRPFLESMDRILKSRHLANNDGGRIFQPSRIFALVYGGNRQTGKIAEFLYKDATIFLNRKRDYLISHKLLDSFGRWVEKKQEHSGVLNPNSKQYKITNPLGVQYVVEGGLKKFCLTHGIWYKKMLDIRFGRISHWHGWKCELQECK